MSLTPSTRIRILSVGETEPVTGTVGALLRHHCIVNPLTVVALEQRLAAQGRLSESSSLADNIEVLTLADLESLESGATITLASD